MSNWTLQVDADRVAWLTADMAGSSASVLSGDRVRELAAKLTEIAAMRPTGMIVQSGKASGFIAGADIKEFVQIRSPAEGYALVRAGQSVMQQLEDLPCPTVAAIRGFALGGGLELALACTYRVGADDARLSLGLPEVQLGIHPGFGGTVRSVQLLGARPALDLMLKGKPIPGRRALLAGLIDRLGPPSQIAHYAKAMLSRLPHKRRPPLIERLLNLRPLRPFAARQATAALRQRVSQEHYPAPYAIVDLWRRYGGAGAAAYEAEARSISALVGSLTSRNLVRVF